MSRPKRHHYVPTAILSGFCYQNDSLWFFSKEQPKKGVRTRNINSVFCKRHLNTQYIGKDRKPEVGLEYWYSKEFDDYVHRFIEALDDPSKRTALEHDGSFRRRFVQLIVNLWKRSPEMIFPIADSVIGTTSEALIQSLEAETGLLESEVRERLLNEIDPRIVRQNSIVAGLSHQPILALELMNEMKIVAVRPVSGKQFIISSRPVLRIGARFLGDAEVEIFTPLAPHLAVLFVRKASVQDEIILGRSKVRSVNHALFNQSLFVGSSSKKLLESLRNSR